MPQSASPTLPREPFAPAFGLGNPHIQTLWGPLWRTKPTVEHQRERLWLEDGDFLDLDWTPGDHGPIALILHGLEGSSDSHYARGLLAARRLLADQKDQDVYAVLHVTC